MASPGAAASSPLFGRDREANALQSALDGALAHRSGVLVLRGEAGSGKTALLRHARDRAAGFRVAQVAGVQAEMELPYAGLHQLCAPLLDHRDRLPTPQRNALEVTFGLRGDAAPDRFLTGLAVLTLLADVAEERSLLCLVDDAQWLDRASLEVLAFVARRLVAEPIVVVLAVRDRVDDADHDQLAGLPTLAVSPLGEDDAQRLLAATMPGRLDKQVQQRIVAEARGNPLALTELPRALTSAELAGGFAVTSQDHRALPVERSFLRRFESLSDASKLLVLTAAAEPVGDVQVLVRAAASLGIDVDALRPAEAEGLLEVGARVQFRHPLVRSTVYQAASPRERRLAHGALAAATDAEADGDRRAWHRAHAADGPDEDVAADLEHSAKRALARGGMAAAAAFLERAATLSADPARRRERALEAAAMKIRSGASSEAAPLLAMVEEGGDDLLEARSELLRGHLAFARSHGSEAAALLLAAARRFEPLDAAAAREAYLDALLAGLFSGRLSVGSGVVEVARAARRLEQSPTPSPSDLLMEGMARLFTDGPAAAAPVLRRATTATRDPANSPAQLVRWLPISCTASVELWDDEGWYDDTRRYVDTVRESGALSELPFCLHQRAVALVFAGELAAAAELVDEATTFTQATGIAMAPYAALTLAAWRGREEETRATAATCIADVTRRGEGMGLTVAHWALAVLHNGLAHYEEARAAAELASAFPAELSSSSWGLVELVEAAVRCSQGEQARRALELLSTATGSVRGDWALGVQARCRALVTDSEDDYREAIDRLGRTRMRAELARAHLLYGEWLRRLQRRSEAREHLRIAADLTTEIGMDAFADRAVRELRATGEKVSKRSAEPAGRLTPQEVQVARYARDGLSNSEIGARMFLSPRTIEWHLGHIFAKLGISSRLDLLGATLHSRAMAAPTLASDPFAPPQ